MKKEDLLKMGLEEEQAASIAKAWEEAIKAYVPKADYDQAVQERKDRDTQLEELKKSAGSVEELQNQIAALQAENKAKEVDNAVTVALMKAGAKNLKAAKALLDIDPEQAEFDGQELRGLAKQIESLTAAEDSKFLFQSKTDMPKFKGVEPGQPGIDKGSEPVDPSDMSYEDWCNYVEANPERG